MVWQRNDDQYGVSRKVTRIPRGIRLAAVGLDQLAKNYSVRALTDGVLDEHELKEVLATHLLVDILVKVGMWHLAGHACPKCVQPPEGGAVIHDFLEYNPDAASVNAGREEKSVGGKLGNHQRWHVQRGVTDPSCEWCATGNRSPKRSESESDTESLRNPPGPVPGPGPRETDHGHLKLVRPVGDARAEQDEEFIRSEAQRVGIRNLKRIRTALERVVGPIAMDGQVVDLARAVILLATTPVRSVEAYIETACTNSPEQISREWRVIA